MGLVHERYQNLVTRGEITQDPVQLDIVARFDALLAAINEKRLAHKRSPLGWLFSKSSQGQEAIKGLYIYGEVGRGKTMLMDIFFSCLPEGDKKRVHFNDFLNDVHNRVNAYRQALALGKVKENDPFPSVAADLAREARILCFDEFTVTDIADAMILYRLFTALFKQGVVLVATSNVAPDNLYRDGLNRQLFLPFIDILKRYVAVVNLDVLTDYRLEKTGRQPVYQSPLGAAADKALDAAWAVVTKGTIVKAGKLTVRGRQVMVPQEAGDAARFSFADLCSKPLAAFDYMALVKQYRTIFIDDVPVLDDNRRNETKRFILLIDTLYDHHVRLFISAAATPDKLYQGRLQTTETFEFERTASRLFEMQSEEYLQVWAEGDPRSN